MKKQNFIISLLLTIVVGLSATACAQSTEFTPGAVASVDLSAQRMEISGETDLADATILQITVVSDSEVQHEAAYNYINENGEDSPVLLATIDAMYTSGETVAELYLVVCDGAYQGSVDLSDEAFGCSYLVTVTLPFNDTVQPNAITERYGETGEKMTGETNQLLSVVYAESDDSINAVYSVVASLLSEVADARIALDEGADLLSDALNSTDVASALDTTYEFIFVDDAFYVELTLVDIMANNMVFITHADGSSYKLFAAYRYYVDILAEKFIDDSYAVIFGEGLYAPVTFHFVTLSSSSSGCDFYRLTTGEWVDESGNVIVD